MKAMTLILLAAASSAAIAQAPAKPAPHHAAGSSALGTKLPGEIPAVRGIVKTAFSLRYEDIKIGTGAVAEPDKLYKVHYTGWLAADGRKFDSSYDHPRPPVRDKDGKPEMGDDGKPKLGDAQPIVFPQGFGRVIPGFDQGFHGMKIGGKRRLFIPWQLAYGARGRPGPDPAHPVIPPKADLIFDIELVDVSDVQMPPNHPGMGGLPGGHPMPPMPPGHVPAAPSASAPAKSAEPATTTAPATPPTGEKPTAPPQP